MKTIVRTQIYMIKESHKGGSWPYAFYFDKEKCARKCRELMSVPESTRGGWNYKMYTCTTEDSIIYSVIE